MKKAILLLIWIGLLYLAARFIPSYRSQLSYVDLLPESARQVLQQQAELSIDVFALPNSPAAKLVDNFLQPLLTSLTAVEVNYIDISQNPDLVQQYQINKQGEMVVHLGAKSFHLTTLSYEAFFNGLKRLNQNQDLWVVFLEQFSNKSFDVDEPSSLSYWVKALKEANYRSMIMAWKRGLILPEQAKLIVLASPANNLTVDQFNWLEAQIAQGVSLLWLADPQAEAAQPALSLIFDVMRTSSFHQGQVVIKDYPEHVINRAFDRPLDLVDVMPFETSNQPLWVNEEGEVLAATQEVQESRLAVVGDSDFLSNGFLYSGGNLEMSFRLIDWLLQHDERIDLPTIGMDQTQLHYSKSEVIWFAALMLIIIPLILLSVGIYFWRKTK